MFIEHISGLKVFAGLILSWIDRVNDPPVEMFTTASVACFMRARNGTKSSGETEGDPSAGFRAWRCRIDAPASAASTAWVAMSL